MSWHYAAKKFEVGEGIYEYSLVEVFPGLKAPTTKKFDTIQQEYSLEEVFPAHTERAVTVYADSPEELVKWLRRAADDVEKYGEIHDI
jgi:nucleoid-associated protein YejK